MVLTTLSDDDRVELEPIRAGRVVRDRVTGSRGVVVQRDPICMRHECWYRARADRPRRDQPWFHVLFDRSSVTGYLAAEHLELEWLVLPVEHPLVHIYFRDFGHQGYLRNARPWR